MIYELIAIYNRDLDKLKTEIELFKKEEDLWRTTGEIKNSAGNLCLHLLGNLNTFIGKNLGQSNYVRDREQEFTQKNVSKEALINQIQVTKTTVENALKKLDRGELEKLYPEKPLGTKMSTQFFLIHLLAHLSYHLGQINYLRRVLL